MGLFTSVSFVTWLALEANNFFFEGTPCAEPSLLFYSSLFFYFLASQRTTQTLSCQTQGNKQEILPNSTTKQN